MLLVPLALGLIFLTIAAVGRTRRSTKIGSLVGIGILLIVSWFLVVMTLGDLSAYAESSSWPSPLLIASLMLGTFMLVAVISLRRKTI